jgi:hypothetical protein
MKIIKYLLPILLTGCVSSPALINQHLAALESVKIGNSYTDMIIKVGYKPQDYKCNEDLCTAFYMTNYKKKEFKRFVFSDDTVVEIINP